MSTDRVSIIRELAKDKFNTHMVEQILGQGLFRSWRCQTPGTCIYGFGVTTWPGYLAITGDLGCMIWFRESDMIEWAKQAVKDEDYMASKVVAGQTREYDGDMLKENVLRWLDGEGPDSDLSVKVWEYLDGLGDDLSSETLALSKLHKSGLCDGCGFPGYSNWTYKYLWCREALRWFLERV